ncbi:MAG: putative Ig domain-containing protein, partial [Verrucomicrobiota bacterium]
TDGDGYGDRYEIENGFSPTNGADHPSGSVLLGWGLDADGQSSIPPGLGDVIGVSAGLRHNLVLRSDGTVAAWGENDDGQATVPVGLTGVVAIAAGDFHGLALKDDGTVSAWGLDADGQATVPGGLSGVVAIAAGSSHSLALKSDGTVVAWGSDDEGQVTVPSGLDEVVSIAIGGRHSLALRTNGQVVAWGRDDDGELTGIATMFDAVSASAGVGHAIGLRAGGSVQVFGDDAEGQATVPPELSSALEVSAGRFHNLVLADDRSALAWGQNNFGQTDAPFEAQDLRRVSAGGFHSLALRRATGFPEITSAPVVAGEVGIAFSHQITVASAVPSSYSAMSLPTGLSIDPATGLVSGTMVDGQRRAFRVTVETDMGRLVQVVWIDLVDGAPPTGIILTPASVMENSLDGSLVSDLTAVDPDGSIGHLFELVEGDGDIDNDRFTIVGSQLFLTGDLEVDFEEAHDDFAIRMRVTDSAASVFETAITLPLIDDRGEDVDQDGLTEAEEEDLHGTSDLDFDTDNDGIGDAVEVAQGSLPTDGNDWPDYPLSGWGGNPSGELQPPFDSTFRSIDATQSHGAAHKFDGTVVAWAGGNTYGQTTIPGGLSNVVEVVAGGDTWFEDAAHTLALLADGTVVGWGNDQEGQATVPVGLTDVVAISAGRDHSLALKNDGTVVAWGGGFFGQSTVPPGLDEVVQISAGGHFSLALKRNGTVVGWGERFDGEDWIPIDVPVGLIDVVSVSAGRFHALARLRDGTVVAWGHDLHGQASVPAGLLDVVQVEAGGFHSLALTSAGTVVAWGRDDEGQSTVPASAQSGVGRIEAGIFHSLALRQTGSLPEITSGDEILTIPGGSVSHQILVANATPTTFHAEFLPDGLTIDPLIGLITGSVASAHRQTSRIWVETDKGRVEQMLWTGVIDGVPATSIQLSASQVLEGAVDGTVVGNLSATDADAGDSHVFELVYGSGSALNGNFRIDGSQLVVDGDLPLDFENPPASLEIRVRATDSMLNSYEEVLVLSLLDDRTEDADGDGLTEAEEEDVHGTSDVLFDTDDDGFGDAFEIDRGFSPTNGTVFPSGSVLVAWGLNSDGQTSVPAGLNDVTEIASGAAHNLALKGDGTVAAWGANAEGQTTVPVGLSGVIDVAAGDFHSLALKDDGTVVAWGRDVEGQATPPIDLAGVIAIEAGGCHSLALKDDGSMVAWGCDDDGQAQVPPGLGIVVEIAAGGDFSLALVEDGTVEAWGSTADGATIVLPELSEVIGIAAGARHALVLKSDGTVSGWGDGSGDQLEVPGGLDDVVAISAGAEFSMAQKANGQVVVWGSGPVVSSGVPYEVGGIERIAAGGDHGLALRATGDFPYLSTNSAVFASPGTTVSQQVVVGDATASTFAALGLPDGLSIDPLTGIISGVIAVGEVRSVLLSAMTDLGRVRRVVQFNTQDGVAPSGVDLTPSVVMENAPVGTVVGSLVAIDEDPLDSHTFAFRTGSGSQDNYRFEIQGDQLVVKEEIDADFEEPHGDLRVRVRATDSASKTHDALLVVTLLNDWSEDEDQDGFNESEEAYFAWASTVGLSGAGADPDAAPFSDGVTNILKYAFNMDPLAPDHSTLVPGTGTAGLPHYQPLGDGKTVRLEYVRRKGSGLVYGALKSCDLKEESWGPMGGVPVVTEIDSVWERVVQVDTCSEVSCFYRLSVSFP